MIKSDHLAITKLNAFPGAYKKSSGVKNDWLEPLAKIDATETVSYTHLTLPTILLV